MRKLESLFLNGHSFKTRTMVIRCYIFLKRLFKNKVLGENWPPLRNEGLIHQQTEETCRH